VADVELNEEELFAQAEVPEKAEAVEPVEAPIVETAEPVVEPETVAEVAAAEEFFPGYAALPEESQKIVRERMEAAAKVAEFQQLARKAEADRRAVENNLAPTQRELQAARTKLREIENRASSVTDDDTKRALEKFQKDYPDEAQALLAVNNRIETLAERAARENAELREQFDALAGNFESQQRLIRETEQRNQEFSALQREHPDYQEIDADPRFKTWLQACGEPVLNLLRDGKASSTSFVLSNYKRDLQLADQLSGQTAPPNTSATKPLARSVADPNPTTRRTTVLPRSSSAGPMDEEDQFAAQIDMARAAGYQI